MHYKEEELRAPPNFFWRSKGWGGGCAGRVDQTGREYLFFSGNFSPISHTSALRQNNSWFLKRTGKVEGTAATAALATTLGFLLTLGYSRDAEICIDATSGCPEMSPLWEGPAF